MSTTRHTKLILQPHRRPSTLSLSVRARPGNSSSSLKSDVLPYHTGDTLGMHTPTPWPRKLNLRLQYAQRVAYRMLADPELSQSKAFRHCAPIAVFITVIAFIAMFPRYSIDSTSETGATSGLGQIDSLVYTAVILVSGVLVVLLVLRLFIWIASLSVKFFIQAQFSARRSLFGRLETVMGVEFPSWLFMEYNGRDGDGKTDKRVYE